MRIQLSDPHHTGDLVDYLRRCACEAFFLGPCLVEAVPCAPTKDRRSLWIELDAYLRVWRVMHPEAHAELLGPPYEPSGEKGS